MTASTGGRAGVARLRLVRAVLLAVCGAGTAGMIAGSVAGNDGAALTSGLITATASVCMIVATAVGGGAERPRAPDEAQAAAVEALVARLVASGADEGEVRRLVREASRLGRSGGPRARHTS